MKNLIVKLNSHAGFKRYLGNTSWMFAEKILRIILSIFISIWVARYLGSESFGLLSYSLSVVGLLTALATLGLDNVVVKELVKKTHHESTLIGTAFCMKLGAGFLTYFVLALACLKVREQDLVYLLLIVGAINIFKSLSVVDCYFQSKVKSKYVVIATILAVIISNSLKVYFILGDYNVFAFAWAVLIEQVVLALGLLYFYWTTTGSLNLKSFNFSCAKQLMKSAWPLVLTAFAASLYMKIDQIMIGGLLGNAQVGQYAVAVRLSEALYFIPIVITSSLFPALVEAKRKDQTLYLRRVENLYRLVVYLALLIALPMSFFSNDIVSVLYGAEYNISGEVFKIHIWASIFIFMNAAFAKFLYVECFEKKYLYRTLCGAFMNIALNYIWIEQYGIIGAAYATLASMALMNYCYDIFDPDLRPHLILKFRCFLPILPKGV